MNRGVDRQAIYRDRRDRERFLELLAEASDEHSIEVLSYCLMGNHFHLLVHTPQDTLSPAMQLLCGRYAAWFNHRHGRDGPLFRGRYHDQLVTSDPQLLATVRYIHRNPVEIGEPLGSYRWSSHPAYMQPAAAPRWLHTAPVQELLAGSTLDYDRLIAADDEPAATASVTRAEHETGTPTGVHPTLARIDRTVATQMRVDPAELRRCVPGRRSPARLLAVALAADCLADPDLVAAHYSLAGVRSVRTAAWRARQLLAADTTLRQRYDTIRIQVGSVPT